MKWALIIGSAAVHGGLLVGLGSIEARRIVEATAISVVESEAKPDETPPPPPPVVQEAEVPRAPKRAQVAAPAADPNPAPVNQAPIDALPDLGFELGGVSGGSSGFAVRASAPTSARPTSEVTKRVLTTPPKQAPDPCQEGPAKPKLIHLPKPAYTSLARQNSIEGKVRVSITVDAQGRVVNASVLAPLGFGLDEAALEAARSAQFEAAVRCGKPVQSTFTIAMRFSAG